MIFDAAHNPDGARALAARPARNWPDEREVVCCLAILAEKDAEGDRRGTRARLRALRLHRDPRGGDPGLGQARWATPYPAEELAELCRAAGAEAEAVADPVDAWRTGTGACA